MITGIKTPVIFGIMLIAPGLLLIDHFSLLGSTVLSVDDSAGIN